MQLSYNDEEAITGFREKVSFKEELPYFKKP